MRTVVPAWSAGIRSQSGWTPATCISKLDCLLLALVAGGLVAIQMASIVVGLSIAFFLLITGYSLLQSLRADTVTTAKGQIMGSTANEPIADLHRVNQECFGESLVHVQVRSTG
ncbi:hypothetical protein [Pseudomonas citri]|uniref:hypothetical protein n=1 Tax=Pseudomonas citri TaxID=2978349 RepID=UPI0021B5D834|nr:hypothetical protein [Pseudomonas citri]